MADIGARQTMVDYKQWRLTMGYESQWEMKDNNE